LGIKRTSWLLIRPFAWQFFNHCSAKRIIDQRFRQVLIGRFVINAIRTMMTPLAEIDANFLTSRERKLCVWPTGMLVEV
jgi:hypothetical protein